MFSLKTYTLSEYIVTNKSKYINIPSFGVLLFSIRNNVVTHVHINYLFSVLQFNLLTAFIILVLMVEHASPPMGSASAYANLVFPDQPVQSVRILLATMAALVFCRQTKEYLVCVTSISEEPIARKAQIRVYQTPAILVVVILLRQWIPKGHRIHLCFHI